MWSGENSHEYRESTLHSPPPTKKRDVVWYVQKKNCGVNFFPSTATGDVYQDIIQQFVSQLKKSEPTDLFHFFFF